MWRTYDFTIIPVVYCIRELVYNICTGRIGVDYKVKSTDRSIFETGQSSSFSSSSADVCCTSYSGSQSRPSSSGPMTRRAVASGERKAAVGRRTSLTGWKTLGGRPPIWLFST